MNNNPASCCGVSCKLPEKMPETTLALYGGAFLCFSAYVLFCFSFLGWVWLAASGPAASQNAGFLFLLRGLLGAVGLLPSLVMVLAARLMARQYGRRMLWLALLQPTILYLWIRFGHFDAEYLILLAASFLPALLAIGRAHLKPQP